MRALLRIFALLLCLVVFAMVMMVAAIAVPSLRWAQSVSGSSATVVKTYTFHPGEPAVSLKYARIRLAGIMPRSPEGQSGEVANLMVAMKSINGESSEFPVALRGGESKAFAGYLFNAEAIRAEGGPGGQGEAVIQVTRMGGGDAYRAEDPPQAVSAGLRDGQEIASTPRYLLFRPILSESHSSTKVIGANLLITLLLGVATFSVLSSKSTKKSITLNLAAGLVCVLLLLLGGIDFHNWISSLMVILLFFIAGRLVYLMAQAVSRRSNIVDAGSVETDGGLAELLNGLDKMDRRIANLETILMEHRR